MIVRVYDLNMVSSTIPFHEYLSLDLSIYVYFTYTQTFTGISLRAYDPCRNMIFAVGRELTIRRKNKKKRYVYSVSKEC